MIDDETYSVDLTDEIYIEYSPSFFIKKFNLFYVGEPRFRASFDSVDFTHVTDYWRLRLNGKITFSISDDSIPDSVSDFLRGIEHKSVNEIEKVIKGEKSV